MRLLQCWVRLLIFASLCDIFMHLLAGMLQKRKKERADMKQMEARLALHVWPSHTGAWDGIFCGCCLPKLASFGTSGGAPCSLKLYLTPHGKTIARRRSLLRPRIKWSWQ